MPRESLTVRIQPVYKRAVEQRAKDMRRSVGYVIEEALWAVLGTSLGIENPPGKKMEGEEKDD